MKRVIYITTVVCAISFMFGLCYYLSFKNALLHYNREAVEQNTEILQQLLEFSGKNEQLLYEIIDIGSKSGGDVVEAVQNNETIRGTAEYILETVYLQKNETKREQLPLPGFMVGIEREELMAYLNGYMEYLPVNEFLKGLIQYEVLSFSANKVELRKVYDEAKVENQYFISTYGGFVTVYYSDLRTVYEYTEIEVALLPFEIREQIRNGFYVKDAKELYSILEGYTS
ncbi:MAG: hypothetical protein E7260_01630 [Lachnospiraceae bacterium]|nr:hypothetical protein [Lachnospiraceae bacterium]